MVRSGEFCFKKNMMNQPPILLYQFGSGAIFGEEPPEVKVRVREFTVSCRSSRGVLFRFSEEFFNGVFRKQCELQLGLNKLKLKTFLSDRMRETTMNREINWEFMGRTTIRTHNNFENTLLTAPKLSSSRTFLPKISTERPKAYDRTELKEK